MNRYRYLFIVFFLNLGVTFYVASPACDLTKITVIEIKNHKMSQVRKAVKGINTWHVWEHGWHK